MKVQLVDVKLLTPYLVKLLKSSYGTPELWLHAEITQGEKGEEMMTDSEAESTETSPRNHTGS